MVGQAVSPVRPRKPAALAGERPKMPVSEQELTTLAPSTKQTHTTARPILLTAALSYTLLISLALTRHEPWADEAQSWLLARDATLTNLWTHLLHYEGTTGLWQTLLHALIQLGIPYSGMSILSALLGIVAAAILLWRAPLPLTVRIALPFTFYLAYQYTVIARSYSLLPLLLFAAAALYSRPHLLTLCLCLMAAVSIHGMALAVALLLTYPKSKQLITPLAIFSVISALLIAAAWPAHDITFIPGLNLSLIHLLEVSAKAFASAFTGEWISSLAVVALSIPLLWKGRGLWFFLLSAALLCIIDAAVYSQVWHFGILFLAWIVALWISCRTVPLDRLAITSLAIVITIQCYWTCRSLTYDWSNSYSASKQAAQDLANLDLASKKLYAIGYATTAIQPYFPHNIFANVNDGSPEAYWDWSPRNHVNDAVQHLADSRPDYVIVGYKNDFERGVWTALIRKAGYQETRHFEGNTFWQTRIFEPESYDLFERSPAP
jgi:hypothetical protein